MAVFRPIGCSVENISTDQPSSRAKVLMALFSFLHPTANGNLAALTRTCEIRGRPELFSRNLNFRPSVPLLGPPHLPGCSTYFGRPSNMKWSLLRLRTTELWGREALGFKVILVTIAMVGLASSYKYNFTFMSTLGGHQ